jgi:hypothetical protein
METTCSSETMVLAKPTLCHISACFRSEVILNSLPWEKGRVIISVVQEGVAKLFVELVN